MIKFINSNQTIPYLLLKDKYDDELLMKINQYYNVFQSYDFSTVVLRKDDIDSAIEVFTRINTGGQTLTLFEIMSAKTYDEGKNFDMQKSFSSFLKELSNVQFDTISSSVLLFTTSFILSKNEECKRKVVLNLDKNEIIDVWEKEKIKLEDVKLSSRQYPYIRFEVEDKDKLYRLAVSVQSISKHFSGMEKPINKCLACFIVPRSRIKPS